jgi:hypothetical protein
MTKPPPKPTSKQTSTKHPTKSSRCQQRFYQRQHKLKNLLLHNNIQSELQILQGAKTQTSQHTAKIIHAKYGFLPKPYQSPLQNAISVRATTPIANIPPTIENLAFHDLTEGNIIPQAAKSILGLGMKFIPTPPYTTNTITPSLKRLRRDTFLKVIFSGDDDPDSTHYPIKLYVKSSWNPPTSDIPPTVDERLQQFSTQVEKLFKHKKAMPNILPFQQSLLHSLTNNNNLLFPDSDKGLGPCAVTYDQYIHDCLIHLNDPTTYQRLTREEAFTHSITLEETIQQWLLINRKHLTKMDTKFIRHHMYTNRKDPFGQFYAIYKIHKGMKNGRWPTRPVCSDVSSLPHGLGKWIDNMLQPIASSQPSYFRDSFAFKQLLTPLTLPRGARLFTCDAKSMYTNIPTEPAIEQISTYLHSTANRQFTHYNPTTLIDAIKIVFRNNVIQFGDTYWRQISGTGMGISPAPPWATIFYALHENTFLPLWSTHLIFYKRFIDDVFGIWVPHPCPEQDTTLWNSFQNTMQQWHGLEWEFTALSNTCNFMDLTITITNSGHLTTTLYEKPQNLYLYIPPHSAHPPGMLSGLIHGNILRIHRLCSSITDIQQKSSQFFTRLTHRGYTNSQLLPLFKSAHKKALLFNNNINTHNTNHDTHNQLFFHLQFHPEDPKPPTIHKLWQSIVVNPPHNKPINELTNLHGNPISINHLTIAYSRPTNLRNKFSIRNIVGRGRDVSSYLVD